MLGTNQHGQRKSAGNRSTRRAALVALLAAITCHGTVAAESPENLPVHAYPPLPVEGAPVPASDHAAPPRTNPYFALPPAEGLITLTAGEVPEPTLLRPMSSKLTLVPVDRDEPRSAEERSSTIQLGQPKRNAFAQGSASEVKRPAASQASFDRDHQISETDGAITFSFSDASDQETATAGSESSKTSDEEPKEAPAAADGSDRPTRSAEAKKDPAPNRAMAVQPEQVREASPVQLAPLKVEDEHTSAPVVVSSQRGGAGKQKPANGTAQPKATKETDSDESTPIPTLLRPIEPILVADDSSQSAGQEQAKETEAAQKDDQRKRMGVATVKSNGIDRHTVNGAPIVIDRGAIAKIGKRSADKMVNSPVVTEGSSIVMDVPPAAPRPLTEQASKVASLSPAENDGLQDSAPQAERDARAERSAPAIGSAQPKQISQPEESAPPMKPAEADKTSQPKETPRPAIEHVAPGSGEDAASNRSATEEFLLTHQAAGDVSVAIAEVHSISLEKAVHCFAVENSSVCQIMPTSSTELRIIGQQEGTTRLAVWHGPRESTQPLLYTVRVTARAKQDEQSLLVAANKLNLTLLQTFPGVDVRVTAGEDKLTVHGSAKGDEQARRILRLIRQACLVPVVDEIVVR